MLHRISPLPCAVMLCAVICFSLMAQLVLAQSSIPRSAPGTTRPASKTARPPVKKSTIPAGAEEEETSDALPRTTRPPAGRIQADPAEEPAEAAEALPARKPRTQGAVQGPAPQPGAADGPVKMKVEPVSQEMRELLQEWEARSSNVNSLECPITRYEFDAVFGTEVRSMGVISFENPDKGRIDFGPADEAMMKKPAGRQDQQGKPYKVAPGGMTRWICTGKLIYIMDMQNKQYDRVAIPPHMQGQNITRSPLPFIFGMKAQDAINRFALRFGDMHNPDGTKLTKSGKPAPRWLHIVANPFDPNVAREYTQAEILLDPETFRPLNLRTKDPSGNKETVYSFDQSKLQEGVKWTLRSPFKDPVLVGWQLMHDVKAEQEQPMRQAQETPDSAPRKRAVPK